MMNQIFIRTDKGEYHPGEAVCGAVYVHIHAPTEAHGVRLSFKGRESVACNCDVEGHKAVLNASHDYVDYYKADLFTQKEPFALGSYCFPFHLQIPHVTPGTFYAGSGNDSLSNVWSASVSYTLLANILGADAMIVEQEVVVSPVTPEAMQDNGITKAQSLEVSSGGFFGKKVHITVKPCSKYVKSGDNARLKMVFTKHRSAGSFTFSIKLVRMLTLNLPYKSRPSFDPSRDQGEEMPHSQSVQYHSVQAEGGPVVVREVIGDLSQYSSAALAMGGGLDNMMIPMKTRDGKDVIPSVEGKYIQCDYSLEVSVRIGENSAQSVSCPIERVLPVENAQWLSWNPSSWMHTAQVKLSESPSPISPPRELLGSEAFGRLPRFQEL